jgi:phosphotransferase system IIB component
MDYHIKREQFLQNSYFLANFFRLFPKFNTPNVMESCLTPINPAQIQNNLFLNGLVWQQQNRAKVVVNNGSNTKRFDYSKLAQECSKNAEHQHVSLNDDSPVKSDDFNKTSGNTNMVKIKNNFSR